VQSSGGQDPLAAAPVEDRGSQTASWYAFQYAVTVGACMELLTGETQEVVVEWHTDYVTVATSGVRTLVSVKHRELDQGPWRLSELCDTGGLATLHARWRAAGSDVLCQWITNAALAPAQRGARDLARCLEQGGFAAGPAADDCRDFVSFFSKALSVEEDEARNFLGSLRIISTGADRRTIGQYVRDRMCLPTLDLMGMSRTQSDRVYNTIERAVLDAARALPNDRPSTWDALERASDITREDRTITRERLRARFAADGVILTSAPAASGKTVMARKLRAGWLGPSIRADAVRLRREWYAIEATFREDLPTAFVNEVERARSLVQAAADEAEVNASAESGATYGPAMHAALARAAKTIAETVDLPVRREHLMGCAYQLTDECTIWWSKEFDTSSDAPWVTGVPVGD